MLQDTQKIYYENNDNEEEKQTQPQKKKSHQVEVPYSPLYSTKLGYDFDLPKFEP